jgi:hypothetical protein
VIDLTGCLIKATAPGKRTVRGVVLPPRPRSRTGRLRLAVAERKAAAPFDPEQWTVTRLAGPGYSYGDLPADLLATRTMLRTEMRREPGPKQRPIGDYKLRKGTADLYAVADTVPLPELSPARAAVWTAARTCGRCGKQALRPLPEHADLGRYCSACRTAAGFERWCEQSREAQTETVEWARAVLADPAAVLIAGDCGWDIRRLRAETVAGSVIFDVRLRGVDDLDRLAWANDTPEKAAQRLEKYADTIGATQFAPHAAALTGTRLIGWYDNDAGTGHAHIPAMPRIARADAVCERLALFSGVAPSAGGHWFPKPRIPWMHRPPTYVPYRSHQALRDGDSLTTEIAHLRTLLNLMAHNTPPAPSWVNPATREVVVDPTAGVR